MKGLFRRTGEQPCATCIRLRWTLLYCAVMAVILTLMLVRG